MGTRGLTLVKLNNEYKVAQYGQFDSYPSGHGFNTIQFITNPEFDIDVFKKNVEELSFFTDEEIKQLSNIETDYPQLLRDLSSNVLKLIYVGQIKKVSNSINFAGDSLFCEWAWCINLDTNCLDCFEGVIEEPLSEDQPFKYLEVGMENGNKYYPIKLICSIPFSDLSKFQTGEDFSNYIRDILNPEETIFENGIPKT